MSCEPGTNFHVTMTHKLFYICCTRLYMFNQLLFQITEFFQQFGYNWDTLKCDFVMEDPDTEIAKGFSVRTVFFLAEAAVPCILIFFCYAAVIIQIHKTNRMLAQSR